MSVQINLSQNQLQGTLPTQLGMCTSLTELDLNNNDVTGTIPTELGRISDLRKFLSPFVVCGSAGV
jgi:Leucine-rich repeat (LRR) protein